jgi:hypothetical protein
MSPSKLVFIAVVGVYAGSNYCGVVSLLNKLVDFCVSRLVLAGIISLKTGRKLAGVVVLVELDKNIRAAPVIATVIVVAGIVVSAIGVSVIGIATGSVGVTATRNKKANDHEHSHEKTQNFEFHVFSPFKIFNR